MADLKSKYLGIDIKNPVVVGASKLTSNMDRIREIENYGAGALVCSSLFEEQVQLKNYKLDNDLQSMRVGSDAEMSRLMETDGTGGPEEHLLWLKKAKNAVKIPVIGSLNAVNEKTWIDYAIRIEDTGVDALECNFYFVPGDTSKTADDIENEQLKIMEKVKAAVKIPVAAKLSYFYTNPLGFIKRTEQTGIDGVVLFNRLFEPDISPENSKYIAPLNLSSQGGYKLGIRYAGLLYQNLDCDIIAGTGIFDGFDVVKLVLAGASSVQIVSALYKLGIGHIEKILAEINQYLDENDYSDLNSIRGILSEKNIKDPFVFKRAQYISLLLKSEKLNR